MDYRVSVIIPTYNAENLIHIAVESLRNQTLGFENIELIIVDDCSADNTKLILENYAEGYENIKCVFLNQNFGPGYARNIGLEHVTSDYLMFLDSDDAYVTTMCETLLNVALETNADIVKCNHKLVSNGAFDTFVISNQDLSYFHYDPNKNTDFLTEGDIWDKIFKTGFIKEQEIKCLEKYFGEDKYFVLKAFLNANEIIYLENYYGILYNVRDGENNQSVTNTFNVKRFKDHMDTFYILIDLLKECEKEDWINDLVKDDIVTLISIFILIDEDFTTKKELLIELYDFIDYSKFNGELNEKWAQIILNNIKSRNFNLVIYISSFIKHLYKFNNLRNLYRKFYNKRS